MNLYITVSSDDVLNQNGLLHTVQVIVELSELWDQIYDKYTHVCVKVLASIPIQTEGDTVPLSKFISMELVKEIAVSDIVDHRVELSGMYGSEDDLSRIPEATAEIIGYQLIG